MKTILIKPFFALLLSLSCVSFAQTVIYSENFNNGCSANCVASSYAGWSVSDNDGGTTGSAPNNWFVSCAEEGITPPNCGSSCIGDASLHVGANPGAGGDMGASYNETGATNATFRMAISPTINTAGYSNLTLQFDFIAFGSSACSDDRAQLRLSADNGATWPAGFQYCLSSLCCGACNGYSQGQWTQYTLTMPTAFNNNPNVRIGFHWRNNGNGSGTDPSVAIDDISISAASVLPIQLLSFGGKAEGSKVRLLWTTEDEKDFSHFELLRAGSPNGTFNKIAKVGAKGNNKPGTNSYQFLDTPQADKVYYKLNMVDLNGTSVASKTVEVRIDTEKTWEISSLNTYNGLLMCRLNSSVAFAARLDIMNAEGKTILSHDNQKVKQGENFLTFNIGSLSRGVYLCKIVNLDANMATPYTQTTKFIVGD